MKGRVEFVAESLINDDLFRKDNDLMKESTALKKAGKFEDAVEKIREAYKEAQEMNLTLTVQDYLKLPPYLQKAGKNDEAWAWFNDLIRTFASDPMSLSQTVSYTHLRAHETGRNLVCRLLLEKASCLHLEKDLRKIIKDHMKEFPNIRIPDVVRDINKLVSEKS